MCNFVLPELYLLILSIVHVHVHVHQDAAKEKKKKALSSKLGGGASEEERDARADEERRIKALMKGMAQAEGDEMFVSTAAVGSIVGLQSAEILQMASEYEEKRADLVAGKKPDKASGAQAHKRMVAALEKQIAMQEKKCEEVSHSLSLSFSSVTTLCLPQIQGRHDELHEQYVEAQQKLEEVSTCIG